MDAQHRQPQSPKWLVVIVVGLLFLCCAVGVVSCSTYVFSP